jgi:hypothetical protein
MRWRMSAKPPRQYAPQEFTEFLFLKSLLGTLVNSSSNPLARIGINQLYFGDNFDVLLQLYARY